MGVKKGAETGMAGSGNRRQHNGIGRAFDSAARPWLWKFNCMSEFLPTRRPRSTASCLISQAPQNRPWPPGLNPVRLLGEDEVTGDPATLAFKQWLNPLVCRGLRPLPQRTCNQAQQMESSAHRTPWDLQRF